MEVVRDASFDKLFLWLWPCVVAPPVLVGIVFAESSWIRLLLLPVDVWLWSYLWFATWRHHKYGSCLRLYPDRLEIWNGGWKMELPLLDIKAIRRCRLLGIPTQRFIVDPKYGHQAKLVLPHMQGMAQFAENVNRMVVKPEIRQRSVVTPPMTSA